MTNLVGVYILQFCLLFFSSQEFKYRYKKKKKKHLIDCIVILRFLLSTKFGLILCQSDADVDGNGRNIYSKTQLNYSNVIQKDLNYKIFNKCQLKIRLGNLIEKMKNNQDKSGLLKRLIRFKKLYVQSDNFKFG